jgi:glycosyltransferase involved in cell wall biosynthesis
VRLVGDITDEYLRQTRRLAATLGIADRVEVVGYAEDPAVHYEWANAVLVCSTDEAFGRVTIEAMKCGRPVIGWRSGATPEHVVDGVDGVLVAPGSVSETARAIALLHDRRDVLHAMSARARVRMAGRHTIEAEVVAMEQILEEVGAR